MPIATPEKYAEMLDAAKQEAFAFPAINVSSSQTLNAALAGLRRGRQRRDHPGLDRRRGVPLRPDDQGHGHRVGRLRGVRRTRWRRSTPSTSRCTPTTAPRTSSTASSGRCSRSRSSGSRAARTRCSSRTCGTGPPYPSRRTCRSPRSCSSRRPRRRSCSRSRSASSAARRTASRVAAARSSTAPPRTRSPPSRRSGTGENGRYLTALTFGNVHGVYKPGNVKLRPEILQEGPGGGRREARPPRRLQALRPGLPRRLRLDRGGDRRRRRLRRDQDERRHRHAVRLHPPRRRPHAQPTTTACSRSTARSATRSATTPAPGARPPRPAWPPGSSRPARTSAAAGTRSAESAASSRM